MVINTCWGEYIVSEREGGTESILCILHAFLTGSGEIVAPRVTLLVCLDRSNHIELPAESVRDTRCVSCIPAQIPIASGNSLTAKYAPGPERSTVFVNRVWEQFYDTL